LRCERLTPAGLAQEISARSKAKETIHSSGRTIFVADAHRDDGKRFVVHAEEKLTAQERQLWLNKDFVRSVCRSIGVECCR
jgi:hypothetical protein